MLKRSIYLINVFFISLVILVGIQIAEVPALSEKTMVRVAAVNRAPVAKNQSVRTSEDTAKTIRLRATDADGNPLKYLIVSGPTYGKLAGTAPNVTYTPAPNYYGPDTFTFKANDGKVDSNVATVSITITAVNDAPAALNQDVTVEENIPQSIILSATDADGDPLRFRIVSKPRQGTLSRSSQNWMYTPKANYEGSDSFTFKANDGKDGQQNCQGLHYDRPHQPDQSCSDGREPKRHHRRGHSLKSITLTASDPDGDSLTYSIVAQPARGIAERHGPEPDLHASTSLLWLRQLHLQGQ